MIRNKGLGLQVKDFYQRAKDLLRLSSATGSLGFSRRIDPYRLTKGRLPIEVWGKKEVKNWKHFLPSKEREVTKQRFALTTLGIILSEGLSFPPEIKEEARNKKVALFRSPLPQSKCQERLRDFLSDLSPDKVRISGGLLQIFGLGVLIVGDSGIGKSESALELICRGHRFICDDVVSIKRQEDGILVGESPPLARDFMEIRGLGIINIKEIFGPKSIAAKSKIDLVIRLKKFRRGKEEDRIGLKFPEDYLILGEKIPQIKIPVAPGRNITTLIEVACQVHILKEKGYHAPQDIVRKINRVLSIQ